MSTSEPTFKQATLDNGLTVVAEVSDAAHTAAVGFFVKTGARDESAPLMGVSHFLEHMMFKGTQRRTADDVNREFDDIGADYNAFTSHEQTAYFAHTLPEHLPTAVDLFADILRPALREDDFDMEKNVILEEIGMYDDRPEWRLQDTLMETYFEGHPLGHRVLGTTDTVRSLTARQMRDYFTQRYGADNTVVAAAGRLDFDQLVADVEQRCGGWQATGARRAYAEPTPKQHELDLTDDRVARHYIAMLCPGPTAQDADRYAAKVLADVLGDSEGSRLYWALVDPGHAEEADFSFMPQDHSGGYFGFAVCDPQRAKQVEDTLLRTIDTFGRKGDAEFSDEEITRAKNKLATQATVAGERPAGRMRNLGTQWTYLGQYIPLSEELDRLMAVTRDDVAALIEKYPFTPRTIVRLGPG